MKTVLAFPRWRWFEYNGLAEPLGLLQVASALMRAGHDVVFADYSFADSLEQIDHLYEGAGLCGVSVPAAAMTGRASEVAGHVKKLFPDLPVVAGGAYPSIFPEAAMDGMPVDLVLAGEAEESMVELAGRIEAGGDYSSMLNLSWRDDTGHVRTNSRRPVNRDLDSIPFPARFLVDYNSYLKNGMHEYGMITSRGCPYNCMYCKPSTDLIFGGGIRYRSAGNVADEIEDLARLRKTSTLPVFFKDDTITLHPTKWFEELRDILASKQIRIKWHCATRVDAVTPEKLRVMAESGCHCISFGVESGSQRILDFYRKGTTPAQAVSAFRWCREWGIEATAMLMIGCPEERPEDLEATYRHLKDLKPDDIVVYFSTAIPGREIHQWASEQGYLIDSGDPELLDPARNRACEVMNMRLPYLKLSEVRGWKHRIERYRSWRKMTSTENVLKWLHELVRDPARAARKAGTVLRGFSGSSDGTHD